MIKLLITILLSGVTFFVIASSNDEMGRLAKMSETLQKRSIEEFMATVRANRWEVPRIPSQWYVDTHVTDERDKRQMQGARDFGYQLLVWINDLAPEQWAFRSRNALFQRTLLLCDLGDWCTGTVGYGNIFLAEQCLNAAADGLKRLTASLDFPIDECRKISARMGKWSDAPYLLQALNGEAGANIFINANMTFEQLERQWDIGSGMRMIQENPKLAETFGHPPAPDASLVNIGAFTNNLHFFVATELVPDPITLRKVWDSRRHRWLAGGNIGWQAKRDVSSMLKYRSVVGFFPAKVMRSEEEMRRQDVEVEEYAKQGIKMVKWEDFPFYDLTDEAFRREWMKRAPKAERLGNDYLIAARVYKQVSDKSSFDED